MVPIDGLAGRFRKSRTGELQAGDEAPGRKTCPDEILFACACRDCLRCASFAAVVQAAEY